MRVPERWRVWGLRSHLSALLMVNLLLTLAVAGAGTLLYRIPRIEQATQEQLRQDVAELSARVESLLHSRQRRLALMADLLEAVPPPRVVRMLELACSDGLFHAVYRVSPQGRVVAVGSPQTLRARSRDLVGSDLSSNGLFQALRSQAGVAWSGRHLSALTGRQVAGVVYRAGDGDLLMGEVPVQVLLDTVEAAADARSSSIWVVDREGEVIADTDGGRDTGTINIRNWPLMQRLREQAGAVAVQRFQGGDYHVAPAHSEVLDWYFVGHAPTGLANPRIRDTVLGVLAAFAGCVLLGLLIAPFWAHYLTRALREILAHATQALRGGGLSAWPPGPVAEFNRLARHLGAMAAALREREQKFLALFNTSPVAMVVTDENNGYRLLEVNESWCQAMRLRREQVLGCTAQELELMAPQDIRRLRQAMPDDEIGEELTLWRSDGTRRRVLIRGRRVQMAQACWRIWAEIDIDPMLDMQEQLQALNHQLEERVHSRTQALAGTHAELSATVEQLRTAQHELVRAEKMAALGGLVAGVAHELNTPVGNGVMAVESMADAVRSFRTAATGGLRRGDLQQLVQELEQGADIAGRNLRRAAELVHSFKQVAVDRTSAQRRSFELAEVVHEMVVSLQPSFARQPWRIEVAVPARGLRLDGYPGALGQTLGNLIQNAVLHGFDGRAHGTVRITAGRGEDGWIWLRVADDGHGIAAEHIDRIFDPFMTTRMGRGGTGLGLHICHNAVVNLLGGTLTVQSTPGQGACFELRLPEQAPRDPKVPP